MPQILNKSTNLFTNTFSAGNINTPLHFNQQCLPTTSAKQVCNRLKLFQSLVHFSKIVNIFLWNSVKFALVQKTACLMLRRYQNRGICLLLLSQTQKVSRFETRHKSIHCHTSHSAQPSEMYCGHGRLCLSVCLSGATFHYCTYPNNWITGVPSSCPLLSNFQIGAWVSLLWQHKHMYNRPAICRKQEQIDKACVLGRKDAGLHIMKLANHSQTNTTL